MSEPDGIPNQENPTDNGDEEDKIHSEKVKTDHTSHWDLDYLPSDQVESAYEEGEESEMDADEDQ